MSKLRHEHGAEIATHLRKEALVHAYGIAGSRGRALSELLTCVEDTLGLRVSGNPDFEILDYAGLGIDDARALETRARERPFVGEKRWFVVTFENATHEAQNALLKLFEDPSPSSVFFLIMPSHEILLPTLRSRLYLISLAQGAHEEQEVMRAFMRKSPAERLAYLKPLIEGKDKAEAIRFLNNLERYLHEQDATLASSASMREALRDLIRARGYLRGRSPSLKMLLEEVALILPSGK